MNGEAEFSEHLRFVKDLSQTCNSCLANGVSSRIKLIPANSL